VPESSEPPDVAPAPAPTPRPPRKRRIMVRAWLRAIHRDLGYLAVALTLAYGLSGIAVNHIDDWNHNYKVERRAVHVGPLPTSSTADMQAHVIAGAGVTAAQVRGHVQDSPREFRVFLRGGAEIKVDIATGDGTYTGLARRAVFFEVNALHLNNLKGAWTWIADGFAVALMLLALTGMFMMKGRGGLAGRGKWFVLAGLAVPAVAIGYLYAG
jgi:hypothetical protein